MKIKGQYKQVGLFVAVVLLPSIFLFIFTLQMIQQESEIVQKRFMEDKEQLIKDFGRELYLELESLKFAELSNLSLQNQLISKNENVVTILAIEQGELLLPWQLKARETSSPENLNESEFRSKLLEAEVAEFSGSTDIAVKQYETMLRKFVGARQIGTIQLSLARTLNSVGSESEAIEIYKLILMMPSIEIDEFGVPFSFYAASKLVDDPSNHPLIIQRYLADIEIDPVLNGASLHMLEDVFVKFEGDSDAVKVLSFINYHVVILA